MKFKKLEHRINLNGPLLVSQVLKGQIKLQFYLFRKLFQESLSVPAMKYYQTQILYSLGTNTQHTNSREIWNLAIPLSKMLLIHSQ